MEAPTITLRATSIVLLLSVTTALCCAAEATEDTHRPKKIYGHYMGCFVAGTGAIHWHSHSGLGTMDAPKEVRDGEPSERNFAAWAKMSPGGTYRNFDLSPYDTRLSLKEAADLEIRRAMRIGLDGFTFDAWAGRDQAKELFNTMMKVCDNKDYPFALTITLDASCLNNDDGGVRGSYVREIKWLLDTHGNSPKLARRGGKPLIIVHRVR